MSCGTLFKLNSLTEKSGIILQFSMIITGHLVYVYVHIYTHIVYTIDIWTGKHIYKHIYICIWFNRWTYIYDLIDKHMI